VKAYRAILALLPLALVTATARAQDAGTAPKQDDPGATANILGEWGFEASPYRPDCTFTGDITIRPGADPNVYDCTMHARDYCPDIWDYHAKQTCVARRDGANLRVESTIDNVEPSTGDYWPDNFSVTIMDSEHMNGQLDSAIITEARFFRRAGPIS
jgi:hypothetical protein